MKRVIIESPYAGDVAENERYARAALRDSLLRGEAPIASHLLYTQPGVLDDLVPAERQQGIDAGLAWGDAAELTAVYIDRGMSRGMEYGIANAEHAGRPIEFRAVPGYAKDGAVMRELAQQARNRRDYETSICLDRLADEMEGVRS